MPEPGADAHPWLKPLPLDAVFVPPPMLSDLEDSDNEDENKHFPKVCEPIFSKAICNVQQSGHWIQILTIIIWAFRPKNEYRHIFASCYHEHHEYKRITNSTGGGTVIRPDGITRRHSVLRFGTG